MRRDSNLDERAISWKVLLPTDPKSRVLALGLEEGELSGLARSYDCLDTEAVAGIRYDVAILGNNIAEYADRVEQLLLRIRPDGVVMSSDYCDIVKRIREAGFRNCKQYAGLPPHQPRLYLPLESARLRAKGLSFHKPGSLKAKLALSLAKFMSRFGVKSHLMKNTISLYTAEEDVFSAGGIINWISKQVGYEIVDLVVYCGSESERRKITALAIAKDGNDDVVVKIADTQSGVEAIKQETEALRDIAKSPLADYAPEVIAEGACGSYYLQIQEKLSTGGSQASTLTDAHIDFLKELSRISRRECLLRETSIWQKLRDRLEKHDTVPSEVASVVRYVFSEEVANTKVCSHRSHGDFAPWNISMRSGSCLVYDWEDSLGDAMAFSDLFHFVYRQAALVGPWPGGWSIVGQVSEYVVRLAERSGVSADNIELSLSVWSLHEYMNHPCKEIEEILCSKELEV